MENDNVVQAALKWDELAGEKVPTYLCPLQGRIQIHETNCFRCDRSDNWWIILFSPASDKYRHFQTSYAGTNFLPFSSLACTGNTTKSKVIKCILILANPVLGGNLKVPITFKKKKKRTFKNNNFQRILQAFLNLMKDSLFEFQSELGRG